MNKDIEWLKKEIGTEMIQLEPNRKERWSDVKYQTLRSVAQKIHQLDEPETLSQEWIDKHRMMGIYKDSNGRLMSYFALEDLQNLLVPKQEELESAIKVLIEAYKQEEDAHGELENGWIRGFIKDLKNLVGEEQKYYVLDSDDIPLLERVDNQAQKTITRLSIYEKGRDRYRFELTEQEIKDHDSRYWPFAVPVEVAE